MAHRKRDRRAWLLACICVALGLFLASPAPALELLPLGRHPDGLDWPTNVWPRGPLPDDLDQATFDTQLEKLFSSLGRGGVPDTRALIVVQQGRIVFERYAEGFGPDSRFQSWSMAKSVTNAFSGILVREGRLELDARAPVAAWSDPQDARHSITLRQLLQMRSGLDNSDGFGESSDPTMLFVSRLIFGEGSRAPAEYATNVALVHPIGERWAYSTGTSIMIARLCGEEVGKGPEDTVGFLRRELFDPLGMRSAQPEFAASGEFMGGAFVHATARDWARFGYLYLRDGEWAGRRILPEGWVDFSRSPSPAANNFAYGAHFWINQVATDVASQWTPLPGGPGSAFMAEGASFQMVVVVPEKDLVAVRLGMDQGTPLPEIKEPFGPLISAFPDRR